MATCSVTAALVLCACASEGPANVVDYDWSTDATALRNSAAASTLGVGGADCEGKTGEQLRWAARLNPRLERCLTEARSAAIEKFNRELPRQRATALAHVCASTSADKVRFTWADYGGNRVTQMLDCGR